MFYGLIRDHFTDDKATAYGRFPFAVVTALYFLLRLIYERDCGAKEPVHLVAEPRSITARATAVILHAQLAHELGKRTAQDELAALGPHRFGRET